MPSTTSIPPWKAELIQKRAEKGKDAPIPEWKKSLLQRLHDKAEAARQRMSAQTQRTEDILVSDEHILKVSDNIFMRKELQRKMSGGQLVANRKKFGYDAPLPGHRVIRKDNMVIIEHDEQMSTKHHNGELHEFELPDTGIVSRLRGRFTSGEGKTHIMASSGFKPLETRSKSSDDILNLDNDDFPPSPVGPDDDYSLFGQNVNGMKPLSQEQRHDKRCSSVEALPTRDSKLLASINITPEPFHKGNVSIKKFSAPTSPTKKHSDETVDLTSLHAPGSPQRTTSISKFNEKPVQPQQRPKLSDRTQEFTKDTATLHANTAAKPGKKEDENPLSPEILTFPTASLPSDRFKQPVAKPTGGRTAANDVTAASRTMKQEHQKQNKVVQPVVKPSPAETNNKENIPEIPKRRNVSITKSWTGQPKTGGQNHTSPPGSGGQMIELGRISMDSSMLNSKAAIAANEIMKESRTIMIVPRGRDKTSGVNLNVNKHAANKQVKREKEPSETAASLQLKTTVSKESSPKQDEKLPTSSIDDVIATSTAVKPKFAINAAKETVKTVPELNIVEKQPTKEVKSNEKPKDTVPSKATRSFVVNSSSSKKVITSRSTESNAAVSSRFGSKLNSAPSKKTSFGGKSFVIDPSKFKRSSAQPSTDTTTKSTKSSSLTSGSSTRVISPKTQVDVTPTPASDDGSSTPKGKRKLAADQIVVIGGYVKLDHSTLSKPNKMRKGMHVKFEEALESIFQYPSESSLLNEDQENRLNQKMTSLASKPGLSKESQLGNYTPKYLLAMKDSLGTEEEEDGVEKRSDSRTRSSADAKNDAIADLATPLDDDNATTFSVSSSSSDLLF